MARPRKARVEGETVVKAEPTPTEKPAADAFTAMVEAFQRDYPAEWAEIALCPTQHGLEIIAAKLKGE